MEPGATLCLPQTTKCWGLHPPSRATQEDCSVWEGLLNQRGRGTKRLLWTLGSAPSPTGWMTSGNLLLFFPTVVPSFGRIRNNFVIEYCIKCGLLHGNNLNIHWQTNKGDVVYTDDVGFLEWSFWPTLHPPTHTHKVEYYTAIKRVK